MDSSVVRGERPSRLALSVPGDLDVSMVKMLRDEELQVGLGLGLGLALGPRPGS